MKLETYVNGFSIAKGERQQTTAGVGDVLDGKTYITGEGNLETGEMTNNAALNIEVGPGETKPIPKGYHDGNGKITTTGGSNEWTLLWTNNNLALPFSPQTVSLDLSKYDRVAIQFEVDTGWPGLYEQFYLYKIGMNMAAMLSSYQSWEKTYLAYRGVNVQANGISFDSAVYVGRGQTDGIISDYYVIPANIYGIKNWSL